MRNIVIPLFALGMPLFSSAQNCNAYFTYSSTGLTVQFTDQSSGGPLTFFWTFGDGNNSTQQNPVHTYAQSGLYLVCLAIVDSNGCQDSYCDSIWVGNTSNCQAGFTYTVAGQTVQFTDQSAGGPYSYSWTFGDGNTSSQQNPAHTYAQGGYYHVCLTIVDSSGCQDTYCDSVLVGNTPSCQAAFAATNIQGNTVLFTDQSTASGTIVAWFWDFDDGNTSTQQHPAHTFSSPGLYLVCLTVYTNDSCSSTYCDSVVVGNSINCNALFTWQVLQGTTVDFNNQSTGNSLFHFWNFGDGNSSNQQDPVHTYAQGGWYYVCLSIFDSINFCQDVYCDSVFVPSTVSCQALFNHFNIQGNTVLFTDQSTSSGNITSWSWTFGDGGTSSQQNPNHTYNQAGTYVVCLAITTDDSCASTWCDTITVGNIINCQAQFTWSNPQGNIATFTDQSTASGTILSWYWDFGDGSNATSQNPTHTYSQPGSYVVCLSIVTSDSCFSTWCDTISVGNFVNCQAQFTWLNPQGNTVIFADQSTASGTIVVWSWDFGDGNTSNQQNPTHTYAQPGLYLVCLSIITNDSCSSTWCDSVWIQSNLCYDPNVIDTTVGCPTVYNPVCGCDSVTYQNSCVAYYHNGITQWTQGPCNVSCNAAFTYFEDSTGLWHFLDQSTASSTIVSWFWDFGDGGTSTLQNPTHVYSAPGNYLVCLTIITADSCQDTVCDTIQVGNNVACQADWSPNYLQPNIVEFLDASTATGNIVSWFWDFGDGGTSTMQNPIHVYANPGVYTVCLTIATDDSCTSTYCSIVQAGGSNQCDALFTVTHLQGTTFAFTDQSTGGNIVSWAWTFGDGGTSTMQNPSHTYASSGVYLVCLTITSVDSNATCTDTYCDSVFVNVPPCYDPSVIDTTHQCPSVYDPVCGCDSITYFNSCIAYYYNGITQWTLGVCDTPGTCQAAFTYLDSSGTIYFSDQSTASGTIVGWVWDFGDGNGSIQQNPVYTYSQPGTYVVCLTIVTSDSCTSTTCDTIVAGAVGIHELATGFDFSVWPNPTSDLLQITIDMSYTRNVRIAVVDVSGREIRSIYSGTIAAGKRTMTWDASGLSGGVYLIRMRGGEVDVTKKVVVMR